MNEKKDAMMESIAAGIQKNNGGNIPFTKLIEVTGSCLTLPEYDNLAGNKDSAIADEPKY